MTTRTIRIEHPLAPRREVPENEVWEFPDGLVGLPDRRRFAVLAIPDAPPFRLLASLDDPGFGLVVVDPAYLVPDYVLALEERDLAPLEERRPEHLEVVVPVVLPTATTPLTLNLRGPILLSAKERRGVQRVSPDESHRVRHVPDPGPAGAPACSS